MTLFLASSVLVSCATDDPNLRTKQGAAIDAIAGAVIGHQLNHDKGSVFGGVIGAIAGASVGAYQDRQQRELEAALEAEGVDIRRIRTDGRGESEPRASNDTAAHGALNHRVENYIKPVIEGQEEEALESPV